MKHFSAASLALSPRGAGEELVGCLMVQRNIPKGPFPMQQIQENRVSRGAEPMLLAVACAPQPGPSSPGLSIWLQIAPAEMLKWIQPMEEDGPKQS